MTPVFSKSALLGLVSPFRPTPLSASQMSSSRRERHRMVRWACKSTRTQALTAPGSSASVMLVPAAASGLSNGALITRIDHQIVENADAFVAAVQSRAPGTRATVGIIDPSGRQRTVDIILSSDQNQR